VTVESPAMWKGDPVMGRVFGVSERDGRGICIGACPAGVAWNLHVVWQVGAPATWRIEEPGRHRRVVAGGFRLE